MGSSIIELE